MNRITLDRARKIDFKIPIVSEWPENISDYSFELPPDLIAQSPTQKRSDSKLLVVRINPEKGTPLLETLKFNELPQLVRETPTLKNSLWVRNQTSVLPARFWAHRPTGSKHEIVLLSHLDSEELKWSAIIRGVSDFKYPQTLVEPHTKIEFFSPEKNVVDFSQVDWCKHQRPRDLKHLLSEIGKIPLPPYIKNYDHEREIERYQTIWRRPEKDYSAAAPTASLHFDNETLEKLQQISIEWADILLHVGLGTFEPLRSPRISENSLHWENFEIDTDNLQKLKSQTSLLCVGTTALRCTESVLRGPNEDTEFNFTIDGNLKGRTKIFIRPGNPNQYVDHLLTNFHLPESSLFILVATFCGSLKLAKETYQYAVNNKFRFFSYGDATLWIQ